jgi:hypothetical protein
MNLPTVTEMLSDEGVGFDMSHLPAEYSLRGTHIHLLAYNHVMGLEQPETPQEWQGFRDALFKYFAEVPLETWLAEEELSHKYMGFGGHPDWIGKARLVPSIRDYKTGSIPLYCGAQLAGYELLARQKFPHIKRWSRTAVLLKPDGKYSLKRYDNPRDHAEFLEAYHGYMERRGIKWSFR